MDLIPGSWEFGRLGTLVERTTRFTLLLYLPRMAGHGHEGSPREKERAGTPPVAAPRRYGDAISRTIVTLPEQLRRSLTWDRGAESGPARARLKIQGGRACRSIFLRSSQPMAATRHQREQLTGLLRQYFPKGTDLSLHSANDELQAVARRPQLGRPRKTA